jgi:hypothetical protein
VSDPLYGYILYYLYRYVVKLGVSGNGGDLAKYGEDLAKPYI